MLIKQRNLFFFTLVIVLIMIPCYVTFAASTTTTGLDLNKAEFGPKIKNYQLGMPIVDIVDFINTANRNGEWYLRSINSSEFDGYIEGAFIYIPLQISVTGMGSGPVKSISLWDKEKNRWRTLNDPILKTLLSNPIVVLVSGSRQLFLDWFAVKIGNSPFRLASFAFSFEAFGAQNMPIKDFAQEIANNY